MSEESKKKTRRLSLSQAVLVSLVAGIACGVFLGDYAGSLEVVGEIYVGLLQMTVLPYIVLSLIVNIGGLQVSGVKSLAFWGVLTMLLLWGVTVAAVLIMPVALPVWESGSFFSTSLVEVAKSPDLLELYIPKNPFYSLAANLIPATVVFSCFVGGALIGARKSGALIDPLKVALDALGKVTHWVAHLSPVGVFALSANAAGTLTLTEFSRLQGYVILYVAGAIILSFIVLPALIAAITPFSMRDVIRHSREALITALATDSIFIVLPLLISGAKQLFEKYELSSEKIDRDVDITMPLAFPFPNAGKLLALLFIPFAAWFSGRSIELAQYPNLIVSGISSLFAKVTVAIPFLLDLVHLPADLFNLFLLSGVLAGRFNSLAGAMHLFAFTLITAAGVSGLVRLRRSIALRNGLIIVVVFSLTLFLSRAYLGQATEKLSQEESVIVRMQPLFEPATVTILEGTTLNPDPLLDGETLLERIQRRGVIRVGVYPKNFPFVFYRSEGELAGFDTEMAHLLARDLGVTVEFVPIDVAKADQSVEVDSFDVMMSGILAGPGRYAKWNMTDAYLEVSPSLVVRDERRDEFDSIEEVRKKEFGMAVPDESSILSAAARFLPNAKVIPTSDFAGFFEGHIEGAEAFLLPAESGSAWTLLYPDFHVATPWKGYPKWTLAYLIGNNDTGMRQFLDDWIALKRREGTIDRLYDHWILGKNAEPRQPRWSIIRNVLGWVD